MNTQTIIYDAINNLLATSNKITKEVIAENSGTSIPSIKRHWSKFKERINKHNSDIKMKTPKKSKIELLDEMPFKLKLYYTAPKNLPDKMTLLLDFNTFAKTG